MALKLKNCSNLLHALQKHQYEVLFATLNSRIIRNNFNRQFHTKDACFNFNNVQKSMDKFSERRLRESIKNTMLKHEEIFKQQVCELHRLYQVQRTLMAELRGEETRVKAFVDASNRQVVADAINELQSSRTSSETTHSSHASDRNNSNVVLNSSMEAAHAPPKLIKRPKPLRTSTEHILRRHIEGESTESCSNEECNLDLSLGIGCAADKLKSADRKETVKGTAQLLASHLVREESAKECTDSSGGYGAESLKRPHWLFQALSLNRT